MPSGPSGSAVRVWFCCKCKGLSNCAHEYSINECCSDCGKRRCKNCTVEEHFVPNLEGEIGKSSSESRQAPNALGQPVEALRGSALSGSATSNRASTCSTSSTLSDSDANDKESQPWEPESRDSGNTHGFHQDTQHVSCQPEIPDETIWAPFGYASPGNSSSSELLGDGLPYHPVFANEALSCDLDAWNEAPQHVDAAQAVQYPLDTSNFAIYGPTSFPLSPPYNATSSIASVSRMNESFLVSPASPGYTDPRSPLSYYNHTPTENLHLSSLADTPVHNNFGINVPPMSSCTSSVISPGSEKHDKRPRLDLNGLAAGEAISPTNNPRKKPDRSHRTVSDISPPVEVTLDGNTGHESQSAKETSKTNSISELPLTQSRYQSELVDSSSWDSACNRNQPRESCITRAPQHQEPSPEASPTPSSPANNETPIRGATNDDFCNSDEYSTVVHPGPEPQMIQPALLDGQGLACHFHKLNPKRHDACARCSYQDIRSLTQHLKNHFPGRKYPFKVGKERKAKMSPVAKWYDVWDQLFPHLKFGRPLSPYADSLQVIEQYNQLIITRLLPRKDTMISTEEVRRILKAAYPQFRNGSSDDLNHSLFPHSGTST